MSIRLQKFMADAGVASRRKCEELIAQGRVSVNGETAAIGCTVEPETDSVELDGKRLHRDTEKIVIIFNKPRGVMCTRLDPEGRSTVFDYFAGFPHRLHTVGRLDFDSEGLLVLTNDGNLSYRMTHPKFTINKVYFAITDTGLTDEELQSFRAGIELDDGMTAPALIAYEGRTNTGKYTYRITIHEGRNRQVRRMLAAFSKETLLLRREQVGPLTISGLRPGEWRKLGAKECDFLYGELN